MRVFGGEILENLLDADGGIKSPGFPVGIGVIGVKRAVGEQKGKVFREKLASHVVGGDVEPCQNIYAKLVVVEAHARALDQKIHCPVRAQGGFLLGFRVFRRVLHEPGERRALERQNHPAVVDEREGFAEVGLGQLLVEIELGVVVTQQQQRLQHLEGLELVHVLFNFFEVVVGRVIVLVVDGARHSGGQVRPRAQKHGVHERGVAARREQTHNLVLGLEKLELRLHERKVEVEQNGRDGPDRQPVSDQLVVGDVLAHAVASGRRPGAF